MVRIQRIKKQILALAAVAGITVLAGSCSRQEEPRGVRIIALADFHGALDASTLTAPDGSSIEMGGAEWLAAYIEAIQASSPLPTLILDGGDMFQGTLVSNSSEGAAVVDFYNALGVTAAAVGNHEFDFGPAGAHAVPHSPSEDPRGALKERAAQAEFPLLTCNIVDAEGNIPEGLQASVIREVQGIKIGIVGASTETTPETTIRANLEGLRVLEPLPAIIAEAQKLRAAGAEMVLLTMHAGGSCEDNDPAHKHDISSCVPDAEAMAIFEGLPKGLIQGVVAGHTHAGMLKTIKGMAVLQPYARGKFVAWADVYVNRMPVLHEITPVCSARVKSSDVVGEDFECGTTSQDPNAKVETIRFLERELTPHAPTTTLLEPQRQRVRALSERDLGSDVTELFVRDYYLESPLGNLVVDMLAAGLPHFEALPTVDAVMQNNGGMRANLQAGDVTFGDIYGIMPFDNRVSFLRVSGHLLKSIVELGISGQHNGFAWSGLTLVGEGCQAKSIKVGDAALDANKTYTIATNNYLATGGSGFDALGLPADAVDVSDLYPTIREIMERGIGRLASPLKPEDYFDPATPRQQILRACEAGQARQ